MDLIIVYQTGFVVNQNLESQASKPVPKPGIRGGRGGGRSFFPLWLAGGERKWHPPRIAGFGAGFMSRGWRQRPQLLPLWLAGRGSQAEAVAAGGWVAGMGTAAHFARPSRTRAHQVRSQPFCQPSLPHQCGSSSSRCRQRRCAGCKAAGQRRSRAGLLTDLRVSHLWHQPSPICLAPALLS